MDRETRLLVAISTLDQCMAVIANLEHVDPLRRVFLQDQVRETFTDYWIDPNRPEIAS